MVDHNQPRFIVVSPERNLKAKVLEGQDAGDWVAVLMKARPPYIHA